jgi:hypothetical protein
VSDSDDINIERIAYPVAAEEINTWRVINNIALGVIAQLDDDGDETGEVMACAQMATCDVNGDNEMDVIFGLNPGAIDSFIGSLCLNMTNDEEKAKVLFDQLWELLNNA